MTSFELFKFFLEFRIFSLKSWLNDKTYFSDTTCWPFLTWISPPETKWVLLRGFLSAGQMANSVKILESSKTLNFFQNKGPRTSTRTIRFTNIFAITITTHIYLQIWKKALEDLTTGKTAPETLKARLVTSLGNCQTTRVQAWLQSLFDPIATIFSRDEYIKDTRHFLARIKNWKAANPAPQNMSFMCIDIVGL